MSQSALNILCLLIFCGVYACEQAQDKVLSDKFNETYDDLGRLSLALEDIYLGDLRSDFNEGSNPLWFSQIIKDMQADPAYADKPILMEGIRFLPDSNFFYSRLTPWFDYFLSSNPLDTWKNIVFDDSKSLDYQT